MKEDRKLIERRCDILIDRTKYEDDPLDINLLIKKLEKYRDEFDSFELNYEKDWDGNIEEVCIHCSSYETDEEYARRKRDELEITLKKQQIDKLRAEKEKNKRKELYEELKKEFENEN
jgi:hypothetical protein